MIYAGVDPGKEGAIAVLDADGAAEEVFAMPIVGGKGRGYYDVATIRERMLALRARQVFVTVERQQPLPMRGSLANFGRGEAQAWNWLLEALRIPYHLVAPAVWQRVMLAGTPGEDSKQRSILAAQRLFPGVSLKRTPRSQKASDGFADALLIAAYGRRTAAPRPATTINP